MGEKLHNILILGAGNIGRLIAFLLSQTDDYTVFLADKSIDLLELKEVKKNASNLQLFTLDATNEVDLTVFLKENAIHTILSSLPFFCNVQVAKVAKKCHLNYFDLTEDVATTQAIMALAKDEPRAFVPQCGLAPGFISIVANELMKQFDTLDTVKLRVGALPINSSNALHYCLNWSTDGLINEYGNECEAIIDGKEVKVQPLEHLEEIKIDGLTYEAFNTSGGLGTLANTYRERVKNLSYKTIRYPGHCEKIRFLMNDLKMNQDRTTLKRLLEKSIPKSGQDLILIYVSITGYKNNKLEEINYDKKLYPKDFGGLRWSAIQMSTASQICTIVDLITQQPKQYSGFIKQEEFTLADITNNRFGEYYA